MPRPIRAGSISKPFCRQDQFNENSTLREQADANTLDQFLASPDLGAAFQDAVIASDESFRTMSEQILGDASIQKAILDLLAREFYGKHGRAGGIAHHGATRVRKQSL